MLYSNLQKILIFSLVVILLAAIALSALFVSKSANKTRQNAADNDINQTSSPPLNSIIRRQTPRNSGKPVSRLNINNGRSYPFDAGKFKNGYKIGGVTVNLSDLDYRYGVNKDSFVQSDNEKVRWQKILDLTNAEAIIQNEGIKAGLFPAGNLDPVKIRQAKDYVEKNLVNSVSLEKIAIFFNNFINNDVANPKIGVPAAKKIAHDTLAGLRQKITGNKISMAQAGEIMKNDSRLADVDIAWKVNAFQKFSNLKPGNFPFDPGLIREAWSTPVNGITPILAGKNDTEEIYYCIIKVTAKTQGKYNSIEELVKQEKNAGMAFKL